MLGKCSTCSTERPMKTTCSKCGNENDRHGQRYCKACHAAYMREHRTPYGDLSDEQKKKVKARSHANVYKRRGKLDAQYCFVCAGTDAEMHHEDYGRPTDVLWLCRSCHLSCHNFSRETFWKKTHGSACAQPWAVGDGQKGGIHVAPVK